MTDNIDDRHDSKETTSVKLMEMSETKSNSVVKGRFCCPLPGLVADLIQNLLLFSLVFGFLWGVTGDMALPGGTLFTLFFVFITSNLFGFVAKKIRLPDLFGMILSGIILRNIPYLNLEHSLNPYYSSFLRNTALTVILVRAGMGLDAGALRRLSCAVIRLAFAPCIVEICCTAVASHFLLGLPWIYGFLLGSVLAAVSPAVVVPSLLDLSVKGYGVDKGIPTLVIAASSVDDILAISCFGVLIGINFAEGNIAFVALKSPLEIVVGASYGLAIGCLLWFIPQSNNQRKMLLRFILLLLAALVGLFASGRAGIGGAGPFAALVLGFVSQIRWRNEKEYVSKCFEDAWTFLKPFLFSLIGAEIALSKLDLKTIGIGLACLAIGLAFRMTATFLVVFGNDLNLKEKIFITISWLPKATVQAAIGGVALDMVRQKEGTPEEHDYALKIVSIAVLSIIVTAPLGAILISILGPKLLEKSVETSQIPPNIVVPLTTDADEKLNHLTEEGV